MNGRRIGPLLLVPLVAIAAGGCGGSGGTSTPTGAPRPVVGFARTTFTDTRSPYDSRIRVILLQYSPSVGSYVARLHAAGVKVLVYQAPVVRPGDPAGWTGCLDGGAQYPSAWYLRSGSGAPLYSGANAGGSYYLDFGNPALQQACIRHAISLAKAAGFDGVFWDGIATSLSSATLPGSCDPDPPGSPDCATDAGWRSAMLSFLTAARAELNSRGLLSAGNVAGGATSAGGQLVWERYSLALDGVEEEAFAYGQTDAPQPLAVWQAQLANVSWSENHGSVVLLNNYDHTERGNTYGLASLLLVANGRSDYVISNGDYTVNAGDWFPEYATALSLPKPFGPYYRRADGVYERDFGGPPGRGGAVVLVNPTSSRVPQFPIDHACDRTSRYSGSGLTEVHSVTMAPYSGLILSQVRLPACG